MNRTIVVGVTIPTDRRETLTRCSHDIGTIMHSSSIRSRASVLLASLVLALHLPACGGGHEGAPTVNEHIRSDSAVAAADAEKLHAVGPADVPNHQPVSFSHFLQQFPPARLPFKLNVEEVSDTVHFRRTPLDTPSVRRFITRDTSFNFRGFAPDSAAREDMILSQHIVPIVRVDISHSTVAVIYLSVGAAGGAEDNYRLTVWRTDGTFLASLPFAAFLSEGAAGLTAEGRLEKTTGGYRATSRKWQWTGSDLTTARRRNAGTKEWTIADDGTVQTVR